MESVLTIRNVNYRYGDTTPTLSAINFTLNKGEMVYVRGESGCGKSTLLKLLNRLLEPDTGEMEFCGSPYASIDVLDLRRKVQLVGQIPFLFPMTVLENFRLATPGADDATIEKLMAGFNLSPEILQKDGNRLSVGQSARVCMIRSLLLEPTVLLLDEPTASLDPDNVALFRDAFRAVRREKGVACVWVTHHEHDAVPGDGRTVTMKGGRLHG